MTPDSITREDVLRAIAKIATDGVPPARKAARYRLIFNGRDYPPKYTLALAIEVATGRPPKNLAGGEETNSALRELGFDVIDAVGNHDEPELKAKLRALLISPDFAAHLARCSAFNMFRALRIERAEIRHSSFLAFLLDPKGTHGMGQGPLKMFLMEALAVSEVNSSIVEDLKFGLLDLADAQAVREWGDRGRVDLLIRSPASRVVVIVENKIDTGPHGDQLRIYAESLQRHYPGWTHIKIYLTPGGDAPEEAANAGFVSVGYDAVVRALAHIRERCRPATDVTTVLSHYERLLQEEIMPESEVARLCAKIYRTHRVALDLIFANRPSLWAEVKEMIIALVEARSDLERQIDQRPKAITFAPRSWNTPAMQDTGGETWLTMLFEFKNGGGGLSLSLYLGPGNAEVRQRVWAAAAEPGPLSRQQAVLGKWNRLWTTQLLAREELDDAEDLDALAPKIQQRWEAFVTHDLPDIEQRVGRALALPSAAGASAG